jgi:aryl-alcohol dehydrogenase-like predicted oxidoreductase
MEQRPFGGTGFRVSVIAYGAMSVKADPELSSGVAPSLLRALEQGVTLIDTARLYPGSEEIVAATLAEWKGARPAISTKLAPRTMETFRFPAPLATAYTPESIRESVDASLKALRVERLDIVHLHQWWHAWTHDPAWLETLADLRAAGKVGLVAVSAQDHEHDALLEAVSCGLVDGVQVILNLFESRPMNSLLPLCRERAVGVIARCALDSGGLTGVLSRAEFETRRFLMKAPFEAYQERLEALRAGFIPRDACDLTDLAIRFCLAAEGVSTVTLGLPTRRMVDTAVESAARGGVAPQAVTAIRRGHVWTKNFYEALT